VAILTTQKATITGTTYATQAAAAGGDKVLPGGALLVANGGGSPITVTVAVPGLTRYGLADPDVTVSVTNAQARLIGPFPSDLADPTDGYVNITYSGVTSVTVAAIGL
jgi:hypothetical protein